VTQPTRDLKFVTAGGKLLSFTDSEGTETALIIGRLYKITATAICAVRFGASAVTAADGGFDFALDAGESVYLRAPHATIRAIRATATDGSLLIGLVDEGV